MTMSRTTIITRFVVLLFASMLAACSANEGILKSGKETPGSTNAAPSAPASVEHDLEEIRNADFAFVYVLRRKDGGPIDAEDKGVIKLHTTNVNRRVLSDGDKAILLGSNFAIPPEDMMALYDRFAIENYSPPPPANANVNANANK